jgi:hypothetical protein
MRGKGSMTDSTEEVIGPSLSESLGLGVAFTVAGDVKVHLVDENKTIHATIQYTPEQAVQVAEMLMRKARLAAALREN